VQNHGKAIGGQTPGNGGTDAGRCAGDECHWPILIRHKAAPLTYNYTLSLNGCDSWSKSSLLSYREQTARSAKNFAYGG
jgi:hypothetical protein